MCRWVVRQWTRRAMARRHSGSKRMIITLIFSTFALSGVFGQENVKLAVGLKAPDWMLPDSEKKEFTMDSWAGKVLQVNYVDPDESELNEPFNEAVNNFTRALNIAQSEKSSRSLKKKEIAELESKCAAKIADREFFLKGEMAKAIDKGDAEAMEQLEKQLLSDRTTIRAECEEKKERVRGGGN